MASSKIDRCLGTGGGPDILKEHHSIAHKYSICLPLCERGWAFCALIGLLNFHGSMFSVWYHPMCRWEFHRIIFEPSQNFRVFGYEEILEIILFNFSILLKREGKSTY